MWTNVWVIYFSTLGNSLFLLISFSVDNLLLMWITYKTIATPVFFSLIICVKLWDLFLKKIEILEISYQQLDLKAGTCGLFNELSKSQNDQEA